MPQLLLDAQQLVVLGGALAARDGPRLDLAGVDGHRELFEDFRPAEAFDVVVMEHVLEHVEDPVGILKLAKPWLAPGGQVVIGVPNAHSFHRLAAVKMGLLKDVYELFVERTGRASTIITSNRDTSEWIAMFDDVLRAQSAVDRFKNAAYDLVIEGESYRSRLKPKLDEGSGAAERAVTRETTAPRRKRRR